jgi:hypothetical protein
MRSHFVVIIKLLLTLVLTDVLSSCGHNRFDIDTSKVTMEPVIFKRLDKDIFSLNQSNVIPQTMQFKKKYGSLFYNRYISSIVNNGGTQDSLYSQSLLRFTTDKDMSIAYNDMAKAYSDNDVELLGDELTEAMKRFKVLFPKRNTPKQYVTFMSGFNYNIVYVDSTLAVGLEMYLGKDYNYYSALQIPKFRSRTMTREFIVPDAVRGMMLTEFDNADAVNNLLNHMIFYGKLFYLCDALLPNVHDSLKLGYTKAQLEYCNTYEKKLWGFFVKDEKLYANDLKIIGEYTSDGPFTASISKECPPRIVMWLGRQIVKSYMDHNDDVTFEDLMNEKDAQKILSKSKYKP